MKLLFEEDLVEAVVMLCATGSRQGVPALQIRRFHAGREKLYSILDPDDRNDAFFRLHLEWFREWGLEKLLADVLASFPILGQRLDVMAFRKARSQREEGAEMYVNETGRRGVMALCAGRLQQDEALARLLHHEFTHLSDMLDPAFGYVPELRVAAQNASHRRVALERYRLLWDVCIDGRLIRAGRPTLAGREQRRNEFEQTFSFLPEDRRRRTFESLWQNSTPNHAELEALATDPRGAQQVPGPLPGMPCPLCGFPTFDWADPARLQAQPLRVITADFPSWSLEQGLCSRCAEIYLASEFALPATIFLDHPRHRIA